MNSTLPVSSSNLKKCPNYFVPTFAFLTTNLDSNRDAASLGLIPGQNAIKSNSIPFFEWYAVDFSDFVLRKVNPREDDGKMTRTHFDNR